MTRPAAKPDIPHPWWCERQRCTFGREGGAHKGLVRDLVVGRDRASVWVQQHRGGDAKVCMTSGWVPAMPLALAELVWPALRDVARELKRG